MRFATRSSEYPILNDALKTNPSNNDDVNWLTSLFFTSRACIYYFRRRRRRLLYLASPPKHRKSPRREEVLFPEMALESITC